MKKLLLTLLMGLMTIGATLGLIACEGITTPDGDDTHSHIFTNYLSDDNATSEQDGTKTAICDIEGCSETHTVTDVGSKLQPLSYQLNADGLSYIVVGLGEFSGTHLNIPNTHEGLPVTGIGSYAFSTCDGLKSVNIGENVKSIGYRAFKGCHSLQSIVMPNGLESIGGAVFLDCVLLQSIVIPDNVTSIGSDAFAYCYTLQSVTIGENVNSVGRCAFGYCYRLVEVINKSSHITVTKDKTNSNSSSYNNENIGEYAIAIFNTVPSTSNFIVEGEFTFYKYENKYYLINYSGSDTKITLPNSVDGINTYEVYKRAFYGNEQIISVTIPDSVQSIGSSAFNGCYKLVEVINKSSHITITKGSSGNGRLGYYALRVLTEEPTTSNFITEGDYTFYKYEDKYYLMSYNGKDTDLTLPDSVDGNNTYEIYEYAFYNDDNIKSVTIPNGVTGIGDEAFYGCDSLQSVTIGESVKSIGDWVFGYTLSRVDYLGTIDQWVEIEFGTNDSNPLEYAKLYINDKEVTEVNITTATKINAYAFYNCQSITRFAPYPQSF